MFDGTQQQAFGVGVEDWLDLVSTYTSAVHLSWEIIPGTSHQALRVIPTFDFDLGVQGDWGFLAEQLPDSRGQHPLTGQLQCTDHCTVCGNMSLARIVHGTGDQVI